MLNPAQDSIYVIVSAFYPRLPIVSYWFGIYLHLSVRGARGALLSVLDSMHYALDLHVIPNALGC